MNAERVKMWTTIAAITVIGIGVKIINKKRKRRMWCRPWLLRRSQGKDVLNMLNDELRVEDIVLIVIFYELQLNSLSIY
jgi:hypothetical protein